MHLGALDFVRAMVHERQRLKFVDVYLLKKPLGRAVIISLSTTFTYVCLSQSTDHLYLVCLQSE